jgi:hypothetical protein
MENVDNIKKEASQDDLSSKLESKLEKDRKYWLNIIDKLIKDLNNVSRLSTAQVSMLSYRQILNDKTVEMQYMIYKKESQYDSMYKAKFLDYLSSQLKINSGERDRMVKNDLSSVKRNINILETHINFYKECIKTLDNMAFAIRNKIKLEEEF